MAGGVVDIDAAFWPFVNACLNMSWDDVQMHPAYVFMREAHVRGDSWRIHASAVDPSATEPGDRYEGDDPTKFFLALIARSTDEVRDRLQNCFNKMTNVCEVMDVEELLSGARLA
jgi:hypothetical protein